MTDSSLPQSDERISAYLDGELTGEEARAMQGELEQSEAARELLRQYGGLRSLIRELPPEALSLETGTELHGSVMRRVAAGTGGATSRTVARKGKRYWRIALPLLATAAGVMLLVRFNPSGQNQPPTVELAERDKESGLLKEAPAALPIETAAPGFSPVPELAESAPSTVASEARGGVMSTTNSIPRQELPRPVASDVILGESEKLNSTGLKTETIVSTDGKSSFEMSSRQLESLKVGETVRALQHSDNEVSVVNLFVVDRDEALNSLQLILASQKVPLGNEDPAGNESKAREESVGRKMKSLPYSASRTAKKTVADKKSESPPADELSLVAVYVEASESQLTAALEELKREHRQFVELAIEEPVETDGIVRALEGESVASIPRQRAADKENEEKSDRIYTGKLPFPAQVKDDSASDDGGFGGGGVDGDGPYVARQQALQVSPKMLETLSRRGRAAPSTEKLGKMAQSAGAPSSREEGETAKSPVPKSPVQSAAQAAAATEEQLTRQMQVLFVLKQRPEVIHKARIAPPASSDTPRIK